MPTGIPRRPIMIHIRQQQLTHLLMEQHELFLERARLFLEQHFPARCLAQTDLERSMRRWVARGAGWGVQSESDLIRLMKYHLILGDLFWTHPNYSWALRILRAQDLSGSDKLAKLRSVIGDIK